MLTKGLSISSVGRIGNQPAGASKHTPLVLGVLGTEWWAVSFRGWIQTWKRGAGLQLESCCAWSKLGSSLASVAVLHGMVSLARASPVSQHGEGDWGLAGESGKDTSPPRNLVKHREQEP